MMKALKKDEDLQVCVAGPHEKCLTHNFRIIVLVVRYDVGVCTRQRPRDRSSIRT